ncbi:phage terminase small subunit P27 family [Clostridium perfringens]|uniref:phage terminase small subunit P27 family n=1 Tax=Clostridium perfringens TaxID=1502 RepID=UPI0028E137C0|nr:phage terminase small subunit P27 family [Clostridium perfringens]MDT9337843.1 phage terminase small subunit P27 family [Clostridium perfringens]MDT9345600.1 phage terminase small subunit P27 family [Clostridium perfringens]MDT9346990.1 phage terminase small subunit P27 family [Clostridium perfringens]MDT9354686.1 phage terminase small subunit P27 family [Clostridium perfringens]
MGRPRKIPELQNKHLTQEEKINKELEEEFATVARDQLEKPPNWLIDNIARKEWTRLVEQLKALKVIGNLDLNNLGAYCNAYSSYVNVTKKMKKEEMLIKFTNKSGATNTVEHPLIKIQLKYSDEMRKYSSLLGLSIDSRLKMASILNKKLEDDIEDDFGDI